MPYNISKADGLYWVLKHGKRMNKKGHMTKAEAIKHMRALYANAPKGERAP